MHRFIQFTISFIVCSDKDSLCIICFNCRERLAIPYHQILECQEFNPIRFETPFLFHLQLQNNLYPNDI